MLSNKKLLNKKFISLLLVTLLVACSGSRDLSEPFPLPKVESQYKITPIWSVRVGKSTNGVFSKLSPTVVNNTVYAASIDGRVKSVNLSNGNEIWSVNLSEALNDKVNLNTGVNFLAGQLILGSSNQQIISLAQTGKLNWRTDISGEIVSNLSENGGKIFLQSAIGAVEALDAQTGKNLWLTFVDTNPFNIRGNATPLPFSQNLLIGSDAGNLVSLKQGDGAQNWRLVIGTSETDSFLDVDSAPLIYNDIAYVSSYANQTMAINTKDGSQIWAIQLGSINPLLIIDDKLIVVDTKSVIYAVDIKLGTILWQQELLTNRNLTAAVNFNNQIVVGDYQGYLHVLNPNNGQFIAQQKIDSSGLNTELKVINDKILLQAASGRVYLLARENIKK